MHLLSRLTAKAILKYSKQVGRKMWPEPVAKLLAGGPALGLGAWALIVIVNDAFQTEVSGATPSLLCDFHVHTHCFSPCGCAEMCGFS